MRSKKEAVLIMITAEGLKEELKELSLRLDALRRYL